MRYIIVCVARLHVAGHRKQGTDQAHFLQAKQSARAGADMAGKVVYCHFPQSFGLLSMHVSMS